MTSLVETRGRRAKHKSRPKLWLRKREREDLQLQSLEMDILDLKQHIESLTVLRSILYTRVLNDHDQLDGSFVKTARQYFDMMHDGFHDVLRPRRYSGLVNGHDFLSTIMDPDVRAGPLVGVDQFISMVQRHNAAMDESGLVFLSARLVSLPSERVGGSSEERGRVMVIADAIFESWTTPEIVDAVYPTLELKPRKKSALRGQKMSTRGQLRFTFDVDSGRVVSFDVVLHVVDASFRVVEDPRVLLEIKKKALIVQSESIEDVRSYPTVEGEADHGERDTENESVELVDPEMSSTPHKMNLDFVLQPPGA